MNAQSMAEILMNVETVWRAQGQTVKAKWKWEWKDNINSRKQISTSTTLEQNEELLNYLE